MTAPAAARRWICCRCSMAVGRIDGAQVPFPESWESCGEGEFCLSCRRQRAAEAAQAAVPDGSTGDVRAKAQRAGLIEFEVRRTPQLADSRIAKACRTSTSVITAARRRLGMPKGPPPGSPNRGTAALPLRTGPE